MGHAYAGITPLPTPRGCPPGWPSGWSCPGGVNPWPPGYPPSNGVTTISQWPSTWPWDDMEDDIEDFEGDYSLWIVMPSENEYISNGQDFSVGVITLDHSGSTPVVYNGSETITLSENSAPGTLAFNNGTTITRTSDYGGILDQVNYTISSGDSEEFSIHATATISGTVYSDTVTFTAIKAYIDISVDDSALDIGSGSTDTEDFIITLTAKDSTDTTVTSYAGTTQLKYTVDPGGSTPDEPTLYLYGIDSNSPYSDSTATSIAATQSGPYAIDSTLWAAGTPGVVTIKAKYTDYFDDAANTDTVVFRAEETA